MATRVRLGAVTAVNPARRELRVSVRKSQHGALSKLNWIYAMSDGSELRCKVDQARLAGDIAIVTLSAGTPRDTVASLRGAAIERDGVEQSPQSVGEVDAVELIGFEVRDADGTAIGVISGVLETPAHAVAEIERPNGSSWLLPLIDETVAVIEWEQKGVVVQALEAHAVDPEEDDRPRQV